MHDISPASGKAFSFAMHLSGKMTVNKNYIYIIRFDRGTAEVTDKRPDPKGTLWHVVFKATCIPEHRIAIEAHEDPADPCEVGAAMRRLEALRQHLVAKSIDAQRLEMQVHGKNCCNKLMESLASFGDVQKSVYFHGWKACVPTWAIGS